MIILDGTTDKIQAFMGAVATTANPSFFITYADLGTIFTPDNASGALNGTTDVDLIAGVASDKRMVKVITICNVDTVAQNITIQYNDGVNDRVLVDAVSLPVGKTLIWTAEIGWVIQPATDLQVTSGVWTPVVDFATTGDFSPTYDFQEGRYWVLGDIVFFQALVQFDTNAYTTASGKFAITGLPFISSVDAALAFYHTPAMFHSLVDLNAGALTINAFVVASDTKIEFFQAFDNAGTNDIDTSNIPASTNNIGVRVSGWYPKS